MSARTILAGYLMILILAAGTGSVSAGTIYVDDDAPGDPEPRDPTVSDPAEDGSPSHPFDTLQEAIDAAINGDEVVVLRGIYTTPTTSISLRRKKIVVRSANPDDPAIVGATILDGQWKSPILHIDGHQGPETQIRGLTIRRGGSGGTGGIIIWESHPTVTHCVFEANIGYSRGGAIFCHWSNPRFENCVFVGNTDADGWGCGGAIYCSCSHPEIVCCVFTGNGARSGGAIGLAVNSSPVIRNCILWGNAAGYPEQSQIAAGAGCEPAVNYCVVQGGTGQWWFGTGCIDINPLLTADGHLCAGSPCIDAGTAILSPLTDREGEIRPVGIKPDIGADEYVDSDDDGLPDFWEHKHFGTTTAADPNEDSDDDDLGNYAEYLAGSDPKNSDTDGDQWNDGLEIARGANPIRPNVYVDGSDGDDVLDGRSPTYLGGTRGPKQRIQSAITAAGPGETVVIAPGTYTGSANYNLDFSHGVPVGARCITVQSEDPRDANVVAATVIDPQQQGRAFDFHDAHSPLACVRGLTLRNGLATAPAPETPCGGAIRCTFANPTVEYCVMTNNMTPTEGSGGAVSCVESSPLLKGCEISCNSAGRGGGVYLDRASATLADCVIRGNKAIQTGGGVHCCSYPSTALAMLNCWMTANSAGRDGGAIYSENSQLKIANCIISANTAGFNGGGVHSGSHDNTMLSNCTIVGNRSANAAGGLYCYYSVGTTTSCILWSNRPDEIFPSPSLNPDAQTTYSSVRGGWAGTGNIDTDPLFVDPGYWDPNGTPEHTDDDFWVDGDYHLLAGSPCIDSGAPDRSVAPHEFDIYGGARFIDDRIDMGADEYDPDRPEM